MMVRAYLEWSLKASAQERAEAVGILADVFLDGELDAAAHRDAEAALLLALDDPAPCVRRMLAHRLGAADRAPRALIAALAQDLPDIAGVVAANSPLLPDAALVDLLAQDEGPLQIAIAQRPMLSASVAAALAEVGSPEAVAALVANDGAEIPLFALRRLVGRFGEEALVREALLDRGDLPADIRLSLVRAAARQLTRFVGTRGWLSVARAARLDHECGEGGAVSVAIDAGHDELPMLVRSLREAGALTPQLLLRSLLSGDTRLLTASLADLAGVSQQKASGFVHARGGAAFHALYRKAGLPAALAPAFEAALVAWREGGMTGVRPGSLSRRMVEYVLTSVASIGDRELDRLLALLMRFQADAARDEARAAVAELLADPAPPVELDRDDLEARLNDALRIEFKHAA